MHRATRFVFAAVLPLALSGCHAIKEMAGKIPPPSPAATAPVAVPVVLAESGVARAVIVVDPETPSQKPNPRTMAAVASLKSCLKKVTGAEFTMKTAGSEQPGEQCIYVGRCAAAKLGLDPAGLAEDEWMVKAGDGQVYLTGGRWLGTANAIWRFLEDGVGMRFWSRWEEAAPTRATLTVQPFCKRGKPAFSFCFAENHPSQGLDYHSEYCKYVCTYLAHGTMDVVKSSEFFDRHPEWYAETGGKRQKGDYCMSAEGLADEYAVQLGKRIDADRAAAARDGTRARSIYSMGREDGAEWCQCGKCLAYYNQYSKSDLYMAFVNRVAERIGRTHPDALLLYSCYQDAGALPKVQKPLGNVIVWYCTERMDFSKSIAHPANAPTLELIKAWKGLARHMGIWHYTRSYERYGGKYEVSPGVYLGKDYPAASIQTYPEFLRFLEQTGVEYLFFENEDEFLMRDGFVLKTWIQGKLAADPTQDFGGLLTAFTDGYYGPAGAKIRDYLELLQRRQVETPPNLWFFADLKAYRHLTLDTCLEADKILAAAERQALESGADPRFLERVRFLRASTMDRVLIVKWNNFLRQWKLRGNPPEAFPVRQAELLERTRQAGAWYGRMRGEPERFAAAAAKWTEIAQTQLQSFIDLPVPEKFAALPPEAVWQFPAQSHAFDRTGQETARLNNDFGKQAVTGEMAALVPDETAAGRQALEVAGPATELAWSFIRTWGGVDPASTRKCATAELAGGAYRWVKLGTYAFDTVNSGLAFSFGARNWTFYALDVEPGTYDVWLSARCDERSGTLFVERLVAVAAGGTPGAAP